MDEPPRSRSSVGQPAGSAYSPAQAEIARALATAGLPPGFHEAAKDVYERLSEYKDTPTPPSIADAAARILATAGA